MGGQIAKLISGLWARKPSSIVMIGLDAAGKTTVLRQLQLGEVAITNPTVGFNVETIMFENLKMTIWDLGGQKTIRVLWSEYYQNTNGVVFVIDCLDRARICCGQEKLCQACASCELLEALQSPDLANVPVLVLANKQDHPQAVRPDECSRLLGLADLPSNWRWHIQGCSALLNQGNTDGVYIVVLDGEYLAAKIFDNSTVALMEFNTSSILKACRIENRFIRGVHHCLKNVETDQHVLFLDYSDQGDLSNVIRTIRDFGIPEPLAKRLLYMLLSGLTDLHKHGFMHRDIKPDNLLLSYNPTTQKVRLVISDFVFLKRVSDGSSPMITANHTICGTPLYMPLEVMLEQPYNHKLDVWASGCILYELLTGEHPFPTESIVQLRRKIQAGPNLNHPLLVPLTNANPDLLDLLQKMFDPAIPTRIDTLGDTLLSHPYFTSSNPKVGMDNVELGWDEFQFLKSGCVGYQPSHPPQMTQTHPQTQTLTQTLDSIRLRGSLVEQVPQPQTLLETTIVTHDYEPHSNESVPSTVAPAHQDSPESSEGRTHSPHRNTEAVGGCVQNERENESNSQPPSQVPQKPTRFGRRAGRVGEARGKVRMACEFCGVAVEIEKMEDHIQQMRQDEVQKRKEEEKRRKEDEQNRIKMREEEEKRIKMREEEEKRIKMREEEEKRIKMREEEEKRIKMREEEEKRKRKEAKAKKEQEQRQKVEERRKAEEERKRAFEQIQMKKREEERKRKEEEERKRKVEQTQREKEEKRKRKKEKRRKEEEESSDEEEEERLRIIEQNLMKMKEEIRQQEEEEEESSEELRRVIKEEEDR
ncbi:putative ADP-ribosylation factor [Blattamonas nauphoetae]|uniref:ADP-ribosylation factor n=1 Tax=Blattamonas nauphoetae TaxID=2049346 RepID=A0ABQ9XUE4_9EUKA|nr:putative ADP-ribosylation factor [Blattamonas nauphoetae]